MPLQRLGVGVVKGDVFLDGPDQLGEATEGAAPQAPSGQLGKPARDEIEPGGARGREVQVEARMGSQPLLDRRGGVRARVIDHKVQGEALEVERSMRRRKARNSVLVWRGRQRPMTCSVRPTPQTRDRSGRIQDHLDHW